MEGNSKPVEMANVEWAKVVVECVVEQGVVYSEVDRLQARRVGDAVLLALRRASAARARLVGSGELVGIGDGRRREGRRRSGGRGVAGPV